MSATLTFNDVSYPDFFQRFSCQFPAGSTTLVVTARETESTLLTRLVTGLSYPSEGSILIDDRDLAGHTSEQLYALRRQVGVVSSQGGLVSNLKVWENILLPLQFHSREVFAEDEESALRYLASFGYTGNVMALPAHLSQHEKRIVAFVRAFLMRPRIMIYANCFEDVSLPLLPLFSQLVREFHSTLEERVSLYLSTTTDVASELKPDAIIHIHEPAEIFQRNT